jgi:hypothetical protein
MEEIFNMSFQSATRQNITMLPSQVYSKEGKFVFTLPKVGLASRLFLMVKGTMTVTPGTGSASLSTKTGFNLIKRVRVLANSGASVFDVSGYGTYLINRVSKEHRPVIDSIADGGTDSLVYAAGVASGANAWRLGLEIPIAVNERDPVGLILLQNNASQITVEVEMNPEIGATDDGAAVKVTGDATAEFTNGSVMLGMEYFTVPRAKEDYPALNYLHQYLEESLSLNAAGVQTISLQRGNTYLSLMHYVIISGALNSAAVEKLRILYNQSENPYNLDAQLQLMLQRERYGSDLPIGTFIHDWYYSNGMTNLGNSRDMLNSANVTEFQSEITIASGTSVTPGTSKIATIKRQLIQIS